MRIWQRLANLQSHDHVVDRLPFNPKTLDESSHFRKSHVQLKCPCCGIVRKNSKVYPGQSPGITSKFDSGFRESSTQAFSPVFALDADPQFATMPPGFQTVPFQVHLVNNVFLVVDGDNPTLPARFVQRKVQSVDIQALRPIAIIRGKGRKY